MRPINLKNTVLRSISRPIMRTIAKPAIEDRFMFIMIITHPDHELLLLWIMAPAGLDGFFRDTCNPPGVPPKQLTREQVNEIARKYATEYR